MTTAHTFNSDWKPVRRGVVVVTHTLGVVPTTVRVFTRRMQQGVVVFEKPVDAARLVFAVGDGSISVNGKNWEHWNPDAMPTHFRVEADYVAPEIFGLEICDECLSPTRSHCAGPGGTMLCKTCWDKWPAMKADPPYQKPDSAFLDALAEMGDE